VTEALPEFHVEEAEQAVAAELLRDERPDLAEREVAAEADHVRGVRGRRGRHVAPELDEEVGHLRPVLDRGGADRVLERHALRTSRT